MTATVRSVEGKCSWGHEAGDAFNINCQDTAGLCGMFYHDILPYVAMLQFSGVLPEEWGGPDMVTVVCGPHEPGNIGTLPRERVASCVPSATCSLQ